MLMEFVTIAGSVMDGATPARKVNQVGQVQTGLIVLIAFGLLNLTTLNAYIVVMILGLALR